MCPDSRHEPEIRALKPADLDALKAIREVAFFDKMDWSDPEVRAHHEAALVHRCGAFVDGELVSSAMWLPFEMHVQGKVCGVVGLASVSTPLEHRRKGYVAALLRDGLNTHHERGVAWSLEYPFDPRFYRRYGWACVPNGGVFKVPPAWFAHASGGVEHGMCRSSLSDARSHVESIYRAFAGRYTFMMTRDDGVRPAWENMCDGAIWNREGNILYLSDDAYVVCALRRGSTGLGVEVVDHGYTCAKGRSRIWSLLGGFDAMQVGEIEIQLPGDDPLSLQWATKRQPQPEVLQARVVNAHAALALSDGYAKLERAFVLYLEDNVCEGNTAGFVLDEQGVSREIDSPRSLPEVRCDVATLSQILSGALSADALLEPEQAELLSQVAYTKPVYASLADYF